ncbi:uncharacterized protein LOC110461620 [Mizuhopecten yessoensis]|uniref:uncharacterized protein LOC110461620 n=1 Tax=Mizuhopecten yessoensis TaxID=6573 RepID=UPI000B457171|nr:uncharacterized protein LOC110461620 [Mizuhopecten yessoensis]
MESTQTLLIIVLAIGACQSHSLHFKSLLRDVEPEIKEKVASDLEHLKLKLPDIASDLHIHAKAEDLSNLKSTLKEVEKKLPTDLQHLAWILQDSTSDLHVNLKDVDVKLRPILKGLGKELFKGSKFKRSSGTCDCAEYKCSCCVHLEIDEIKLDSTVCVAVAYLPKDIGVEFKLTVDGKTLIDMQISVTNPPPVCIGIPELEKEASICIMFSNLKVDTANKKFSGCVSLEARLISIKVVEVPLGCFNMPIKGAETGNQTVDNISNRTQMSKQEKMEMLSRLGLMGKTFNNGRLVNQKMLKN